MKENTLGFYKKTKSLIPLGTEIKLIENIDYDHLKIKYSRRKRKVNEIDLQASGIDIYVNNKGGGE